MRARSLALTLIGPLAVTLAVAGPATAAIVAAGPAPAATAAAAAMAGSDLSHSTSQADMAGMTMTGSTAANAAPAPQSRPHHRDGLQGLPKLKGVVGPGFTISINKASVPAGKYKFVVADMGDIHNFHLTGAGVDQKTEVPFVGKVTWKVKLKQGTYNAQCDPHSSSMKTSLTVTA